jgi:photosystem II stability/assembly factor-like uncharacterized protein
LADGPHFVCVQNHDILRSWSASACATTIVDFTPPNAPIASGATPTNGPKPTWTWTAGGGGNGTYRYRLDNPDLSTGATSTTSLAFTPTTDLAAGSHTLCVQERDTVGNWSASGCATVVIDLTSPNAPIASGPTPTNSPKPTWTWTTGGGGNGTYRYRLDDPDLSTGATSTTSLTFTPTEDLAAGSHTLCVQERDTVGNWSASGCATVVIDLTPPGAPIASGPTPTNNPKPTWTWTAGGGGNGTYRYRLDDPDLSTGATVTTSLAFTPTTDLGAGSHTLCVQERDAAGNWSVSGCASLVIGLTPPGAPIISGPPLTNNPKPTWTWTAGGGGNGTYRYRVDNPDLSTDATVTTSLTFTPTADLGAGSHTLCVQERDAAGNWSASGCATAVIDLTPPARPVVKRDPAIPMRTSNRRPTWTWIGGGGGQGVYRIKMDESNLATGATQTSNASFTPDSDLAYGSHTLYVQERDSAGNWSSYGSSSAIITNPAAQTFVAAGEGVINITTDGGETWQPQVISETVRQMLFVNSTTGWAITSGGSLRKTTNAGATWIDQSVNSEVVSSISFVDVNTGWAVGLNGLFKTTNSGQTWTGPTRDYPASILPGSVQFVNANVGWVSGGQTGGTWKTLDGGETWTKQQAGSIGGRYISEDTGWANVDGGFAKTTDGGVTWTTTLVTTQLGQDNYSPFFFVDDNTGWGAGQYGSIIRTTNAGLTWTLDYGGTPVIDGFHALYFNNAGKGFVAGDKGRIMRSTGGANAWTPLNTSTKARLWYIGPIP